MKIKKVLTMAVVTLLAATALVGCGKGSQSAQSISVISREEGSGTRGAFVELTGVEEKVDGQKVDQTTQEAVITNSTSVMMSTVANDTNAIGYISLGSLNDSVKAVKVDGIEATAEKIKSGEYKIARPFNLATKETLSTQSKDFIDFILSKQGQKIVESNGYIPQETSVEYQAKNTQGKITVAGSSSVSPVMEKLKEEYEKLNPQAEIEIQTNDSTTGVSSAIDGICDIGMASRELKDSELQKGVKATVIATDGIAVIVNKENSIDNLTMEQIKNIFTGKITSFDEVK